MMIFYLTKEFHSEKITVDNLINAYDEKVNLSYFIVFLFCTGQSANLVTCLG